MLVLPARRTVAPDLHSVSAFPRAEVLRTAAHALRPGGLLLVVDHGDLVLVLQRGAG